MIHAEEIKDKLVLTYLLDYPEVVNGKVVYRALKPIDLEKGTVGKMVDDELIECKLEYITLEMTEELKTTLLNQLTWTEIVCESGQTLLFPPNLMEI